MPRIVKSARGKVVDMQALTHANEKVLAVSPNGSHNMNARGDIIGPRGKILVKVEDRERPYSQNLPNAVKNVSIKADNLLGLDSNANQPKKAIKPEVGMMTKANPIFSEIETLQLEDLASIFANKAQPAAAQEEVADELETLNGRKNRRRITTKG